MDLVVREVSEADYAVWRDLWDQYLVFYEATVSSGHAEALWLRLLDGDHPMECLVATADAEVVGIVQFFPHPDTWSDRPVCYLQDLFVRPGWRGRGIGASLIRSVSDRAAKRGWSGVYWQTAEDNEQARRLYDYLTGGPSGFIVYELEPPE
jgi:GNAT superfamily N-acetyltransferase